MCIFALKMKQLSILIPTYNDACTALVATLQQQAEMLGTAYEIIVADDGSTRQDTILQNRAINDIPNCQYIERKENMGRAAIRNFLATQARYPFLLFIDADMVVPHNDFLRRYAEHPCTTIIDGGVIIRGRGNAVNTLRYRYEKNAEKQHLTEKRRQHPYQHFHTANVLVSRDIMLTHPFDIRFRHYGYEDVFFGQQMLQHHIIVEHIDNPLSFEVFEDNVSFISKTEEGLRTLHHFQDELAGYSSLLNAVRQLQSWKVLPVVRLWHLLMGKKERALLCSGRAPLWMFTLYRLGYFLSINNSDLPPE